MADRFDMRAALRKLRRKPRAPARPPASRDGTEARRRRPTPYALSRDPTAGGDNWREFSVLPRRRAERVSAVGEPSLREAAPYAMVTDPDLRERWCEYVPTLRRDDLDVPTNAANSDDSGAPTVDDAQPASPSPSPSATSTEPSDASAQDPPEGGDGGDKAAGELLAAREAAPYGMTHDPTTGGKWREAATSRQRRDLYGSFIVDRELEEELCCICLEPFGLENVARGHCGHLFHTACIAEWMAKDDEARSCPVCRLPFMGPEHLRYCFVKR